MKQESKSRKPISIVSHFFTILIATIIVLLYVTDTHVYAAPADSTLLTSIRPTITNSNIRCKRVSITGSNIISIPNDPNVMNFSTGYATVNTPTASPYLPRCPAGQVPVGVYTGSISGPNAYTKYKSTGIFPSTSLKGVSMVVNVTGWGFSRIYYAYDLRNDGEQNSAQFHYRSYQGYSGGQNPINKVQLICAPRSFTFQANPCP